MSVSGMEFEFLRFRLARTVSRSAVRQLLVERAEHGGWELARLRLYADGTRRVELRRRIIRVRRAADADPRPMV